MAAPSNAPNPLRPYYIPPSIGLQHDLPQGNPNSTTTYPSRTLKPSFGSQARDILSDLDYDSYLSDSSPGVIEHGKRLLDQALWNYTSVLLAQPFEVAKTLLQIHQASARVPTGLKLDGKALRSRPESFASGKFEDYPSDDSDPDSPGYFTSTAPQAHSPNHDRGAKSAGNLHRQRRRSRSRDSTPTRPPRTVLRKLELAKADSLLEVVSQLWQKESAWGVWKGTNVTFVYNFLLKTTESWTRSLLAALLNVPDPGLMGAGASLSGIGGLDIIDSPSPFMSLSVAVAATAIAATLLAPLDLIRTRLIVTPTSAPPRTIYPSLALLPQMSIPPTLFPITLLHAMAPTFISTSAPLFFRSVLSIDPIMTPSAYSVSTFLSSTVELFLRLPLETVLRRGQVAVLQEHENERLASEYRQLPSQSKALKSPVWGMENEDPRVRSFKTIVEPGPFTGVWGTMWFIMREEGVQVVGPNAAKAMSAQGQDRPAGYSSRTRVRKGQGINGLWRGWRVGFWGLVGVWGAAALGGGGGEF